MSNAPKFAIDDQGYLLDNTEYYITGNNLKFLIQFLNSKLYTWYFDTICISGMGARKWRKQYVEMLCIPTNSTEELDIKTQVGLTQEEQDWIENLELLGW